MFLITEQWDILHSKWQNINYSQSNCYFHYRNCNPPYNFQIEWHSKVNFWLLDVDGRWKRKHKLLLRKHPFKRQVSPPSGYDTQIHSTVSSLSLHARVCKTIEYLEVFQFSLFHPSRQLRQYFAANNSYFARKRRISPTETSLERALKFRRVHRSREIDRGTMRDHP